MYNFQTIPHHDYILKANRIDVWLFSLLEASDLRRQILSEDELLRADRFVFERHRRRFTVARSTLRQFLGCYLKQNPKHIQFDYLKNGKPFIKESNIEFNLSHSGDWGLLAIGQNEALGIDIEFFSSRPYQGIAEELFSEEECMALKELPKTAKTLGFFHIWAQKEAFIKASGLGLSYPTKTFTVPHVIPTNTTIYDSLHNKNWHIKSFMPKLACSAALCFNPLTVETLRFKRLSSIDAKI